jgi:hypothetical protein
MRRGRAHAMAWSTLAKASSSRSVVQVGGGRTISPPSAWAIASAGRTQALCVVSVSSCAGV